MAAGTTSLPREWAGEGNRASQRVRIRPLYSEGGAADSRDAGLLASGSSLPTPSPHLGMAVVVRSPVTVAVPRRICTGFPILLPPERKAHPGSRRSMKLLEGLYHGVKRQTSNVRERNRPLTFDV